MVTDQVNITIFNQKRSPAFFNLCFRHCCRDKSSTWDGSPYGPRGLRVMENRERPAMVGAPRELKIFANRVNLMRRESFGREEQASMDERERRGGRRERVVQVFVVLFGDLECGGGRHGWKNSEIVDAGAWMELNKESLLMYLFIFIFLI
ncbi:hypothetical protein PanWU01x14_344770 [Parasponia andersonii]|uniref:Uncharacterized protein n=1 Tax=Parasponia andersonii TaxID=3476 RepID=A0A2P5ACX2_PARAD|nr:hypothetical protein PanWU01x14_344770 [Parasponia andersonii]